MRRKARPDIDLKQAVDGHLRHVRATWSVNTLNDYTHTHALLLGFFGDEPPSFRAIYEEDIEAFLTAMRETPINRQRGAAAVEAPRQSFRKPKTLQNIHTALSSLWAWGVDRGYVEENIISRVARPKVQEEPVVPLSNGDLLRLFGACLETAPYRNKPLRVTNYRPTADRDRVVIALLTECMLRVSELSELRRRDVTIGRGGNGVVWVELGKGGKSRSVPFGRECARILDDYLTAAPKMAPDDLFIQDLSTRARGQNKGKGLERKAILQLVRRIGRRAGVDVHPHLLRTTGACMAIRNGISPRVLQVLMGHSNIATTMRYVRAAELDLEQAMANASPLDNLRK